MPEWVVETHEQAEEDLGHAAVELNDAAERLAQVVAMRSTPDELVALDVVQRAASTYLAEAGEVLELLAQRQAAGLADRLRELTGAAASAGDAEGQAIVDAMFTWDRAVRAYTTMVQQYVAGVVQGGGIALGLYVELGPGECADIQLVGEVVHRRLSFVPGRLESAIEAWIEEVEQGLGDLLGTLSEVDDPGAQLQTVRSASMPEAAHTEIMDITVRKQAQAKALSRAKSESPPDPALERLNRLLELAKLHKISVRKVPETPSSRYLDKLQAQLAEAIAKRSAARAAADARRSRLDELLAFAKTVRVKVKKVPKNPSTGWLNKMEAKLADVAARKNVPLPESFEPPTQQEQADTPDEAPERVERDRQAAAMRARAAEMVARAEGAGLELGRVPTVPTDEWISETQNRLESAVAQQQQRNKHERQRADQVRRERVERLKLRAFEAEIDLGPVPPLPTTHWLERAEDRVAKALGDDATVDGHPVLDPELARRLEAIEARAAEHELSLGSVPPVPDAAWFQWAEERLEEADLADELLAVPATTDGRDEQAVLIYEEGTVQEQIWVVEDEALTIGRARGNVVQIRDDSGVSRRHCTLMRVEGGYVLRDESSTKGTVVDGRDVDELQLGGGERITIGETNFTFRIR